MTDKTPDCRTVGEHFLDFTIAFFNLAKSKYQQQNQIKANSVGFQALIILSQPGRPAPTMSGLAAQLEITKQQLTKLVNDLEEKQLVRRQHDSKNRRLVYLEITPTGACIVKQLKEAMLNCTVAGLSGFSDEELAQLDDCLMKISGLLSKFNPDLTGVVHPFVRGMGLGEAAAGCKVDGDDLGGQFGLG